MVYTLSQKVSAASPESQLVLEWASKVAEAGSWKEFAGDERFDTLSSKIIVASPHIESREIGRIMHIAEETLMQTERKILNGRQHAWFFYDYFKVGLSDVMVSE